MANISVEREGLPDGMPRDDRGYWRPDGEIGLPNPVFAWPPKPVEALKWLKEYIWPFNIVYMLVAYATWLFLTPEMSRMAELEAGWALEVLARNQIMLICLATALHLRLWTQKGAGLSIQVVAELDEQEPQVPLE